MGKNDSTADTDHTELTGGVPATITGDEMVAATIAKPTRRPIKPSTLLAHVLDHIESNQLSVNSAIDELIHSIEQSIISNAIGELGNIRRAADRAT